MQKKGYILIFSTAIISGFSIFINKFGVSIVNSDVFTFLKNALVALMISALIIMASQWKEFAKLTKKQWGQLIAIGFVGGSIPFILFFKGLFLSGPAGASIIHKTMFIWVFLLAWYFLKEKISKNLIIAGMALLTANLMLLKITSMQFSIALLLVLAATLFWAIENTISKHALKSIQPQLVVWGRMFFGATFIFIYLIATKQASLITELSIQQTGWTLISAVLLFAYVGTWYTGLKYIPLSEAAVILMLGAPITTALEGITKWSLAPTQYISIFISILAVGMLISTKRINQLANKKNHERH